MDKAIILKKLIEKKIIDSENEENLNQDLKEYLELLLKSNLSQNLINQILESNLLEKYDMSDLGFIIENLQISNYKNGIHTYRNNNGELDIEYKYNLTKKQLEKLKRIKKENIELDFEITSGLFELDEFWNLDDDIFKYIATSLNDLQQGYIEKIIKEGKLGKWLELRKENDFIPRDTTFLKNEILDVFTLDEVKILSTAEGASYIANILDESIKLGTLKNVASLMKKKIENFKETKSKGSYTKFDINIKNPENYTDENIEIFGIENIETYGNEIIENEEYLRNYTYIKENYGQMKFPKYASDVLKMLSNENVSKIGYETIFLFFDYAKDENIVRYEEKFRNIPKEYTKEQLEEVIKIYGTIPQWKELYNEKILEAIKNSKEKSNFNNEWVDDGILQYIIKENLEKNIVTMYNTDFDKFASQNRYGKKTIDYQDLELMTPKILNELGIETVAKLAKMYQGEIVLELQENDLLRSWKSLIDKQSTEEDKTIICSIESKLILDEKNKDLSTLEIKKINETIENLKSGEKEKFEDLIKDNPDYIRLLQVPQILLKKDDRFLFDGKMIIDDENIDKLKEKFEKFKSIERILEGKCMANLINKSRNLKNVYDMMQKSYENGTLNNWKKALEIDDKFVPFDLEILKEDIVANNSIEDIIKINNTSEPYERYELLNKIKELHNSFFYIYNLTEILNMNIKMKKLNLDYNLCEKIQDLMKNEKVPANLKSVVKEIVKDENISNKEELIDKAKRFNEISKFIPAINVLRKYPENQIEKFNKKIWFNLARNSLYSKNEDTKAALVEAALSLGIFENDEGQEERLGLLQKFATYLPKDEIIIEKNQMDDKENQDLIKENFEVVNKKLIKTYYYLNTEKLLNDSDLLALFNSKEEAETQFKKLSRYINKEEMNKLLNTEYVNENYKKIMDYIYKTCYRKEDEYAYTIKLKTDIQEQKRIDKKKGQILEERIRNFYYKMGPKQVMTPSKLHKVFDGMDMKFKEGFFGFFRDNLEQILESTKMQLEIPTIQRQWDKIVEANLGQKINFEKCEAYIFNHKYENVQEDEKEIAKLSSSCGYEQQDFKKIQEIFRDQKKRTISSIPQIERKNEENGYSYKVLRLDDPVAIFVGELTKCCQALNNAGESCMKHSVTSQNGRVLVVQDENGKVISQSWIWRNKNILCFDNIEAVKKDANNKKIISSEILDTIKQASKDFVETDKKRMEVWKKNKEDELKRKKENGEITQKEFDIEIEKINSLINSQQLSKVTVGIGYTDVNLKGLKKDNENIYPEESVEYISDSRNQLILYEDEEIENTKNELETIAIYSDSDEVEKLMDVDTSEINSDDHQDDEFEEDELEDDEFEEDYDYDDFEYYGDEYAEAETIEEKNSKIKFIDEVYETEEEQYGDVVNEYVSDFEKIDLENIKKAINNVAGRNQARRALINITKKLNNERGK